jgi:CubicO group peptidase (beta-lactamase class C family)
MFPRRELFDKIGMSTAVLEPDESGTFVGSSYLYASARDWARLGLLLLNDGVWEGERLLPEGWVAWSTTPTLQSPGGSYGAHIWLDPRGIDASAGAQPPFLPEDAFFALGHDGQSLTIIPSRKLVVIRLGITKDASGWDLAVFLSDIIAAVE